VGNLSLWLVNLLPVPMLDGRQLLEVVLEMAFATRHQDSDLELLEGGAASTIGSRERMSMARERNRWKGRVRAVIEGGTLICIGLSVILSVVGALT
jgi:membrane-associated protease RseP (regulator of RpoE activity)